MENASKALMMAGSVLLTILVLGMIMLLFTQIREAPRAQEEALEQAQITKFNRDYESYDKKRMYGVDVLTVLNKAIANNKSYANVINDKYYIGEGNYYIDVEITLLTPIISFADKYIDAKWTEQSGGTIKGKIDGKGEVKEIQLGTVLKANTPISLLKYGSSEVFLNKDIADFLRGDFTRELGVAANTDTVKISIGEKDLDDYNYALIHSGFIEFKRKYFECTGVEYNKATSRVSKLIFREINKDNI